ncbi:hypothetical protein ALC62_12385 [Cyphomyrmex costatus]|uniref:Gustatory receptor n=1 Tax=Cyphomyrmex costatus TaxID=456900 RepID=A0A151IBA6_9HYME|nr:hypothetical protein ALC62_12385 [Cyphomyrmex costatus]
MILSILYRIINQYNFFKELKICLHELSIVNDTLEVLGARNQYCRLHNWIIRIIIGSIVYILFDAANAIYSISISYKIDNYTVELVYKFVCICLITIYIVYIQISNVLICGIVLGYTCSRFHQVNDRLHVLYSDLIENNADYRYKNQNKSILVRERTIEVKNRKQSIWILM